MPKINIMGMPLTNANGDVDASSAGYKYIIDTLSHIREGVIEQKFYEVAPADFIPVDVGEASWADEIVQNLEFQTGGDFFQGDADTLEGNGRVASVGAATAPIRMPVKTWAKNANWTIMEIAKAAQASRWDVVESKLRSLKKNWDLGIQQVAFLGHPTDSSMTGLLNDAEVTINTALITEPLSDLSETAFTTFLKGLLGAYFTNSNSTQMPDTFVMPTDDYLGMSVPYSSTYPNISKLEYLLNSFKKMTGNEGFQILPLAYAQDDFNADILDKNRYVLYRNNEDTLKMSIPVDFTMLEADTSNRLYWNQPAYGQYSGVLVNRKREVLYLDETATT